MVATDTLQELAATARRVRRHIVQMTYEAQSGHPGGSLSAVEIVTSLFFGGSCGTTRSGPDWPDRDRFILSKGHATPVLLRQSSPRRATSPSMN